MQGIEKVEVNSFCDNDMYDEVYFDIDFYLTETGLFSVFGQRYEVDRVKMLPEGYKKSPKLYLASKDIVYRDLKVPDSLDKLICDYIVVSFEASSGSDEEMWSIIKLFSVGE